MSALTPNIGETATGTLPSAQWENSTGTGEIWYGTVAISPLTYTGTWSAGSSTPLTSTSAGNYAGTADGVEYTVKVSSATSSGKTGITWTSNDSTTGVSDSGSGTATAGQPLTLADGITITFDSSGSYKVGDTYTVLAGTQGSTAMTVDTGVAPTITATSASLPPSYMSDSTTIPAGSTPGTINSSGAVDVLQAPQGNQTDSGTTTGYFTAAPGVSFNADANSWAGNYSGSLQYTIQTTP